MGATLALPFLDAMVPALSAAAKTAATAPPRLGFVYTPNGVNWMRWTPEGDGGPLKLSPTLESRAPFRDQLTVLSQLSSVPGEAQGDGSGDHARAQASWLSGAHAKKTEGSDYRLGKTVDQFAADELGRDSRFPSLQLGLDDVGMLGQCEPGFACAYQTTLSWSSPSTPLPMQINPRVVFERLVGGDESSAEERRALARAEGTILDALMKETHQLKSRLGVSDARRLDEYLDGIRQLEGRIKNLETQGELSLSSASLPVGIPDSFEEHIKVMFDLQVLAFQGDLTRVITFLIGRESGQRTYPQIGVPDAHHGISHHANDPVKLEKQAKIDTYHVLLLGYFLDRLRATPDGDGSLLDHSLIMYGGALSNGHIHSHRNLPTLIAGGGNGQIKGGRHIICSKDTPLTNLQLRLLEKVGVRMDTFGDSTGPLVDL